MSSSTDPYNKSFEDERRNLIEGIKSILQAKVEAIEKTISGLDLQQQLKSVGDWRTDNFSLAKQRRQQQ